jgi:acyl-CoA reductase-like NAD-dependent aldehyde dehydrogenase
VLAGGGRASVNSGLEEGYYVQPTGWARVVWSRDANTCYRMGRAIQAGRVWTNCYHASLAHAAFGGYKQSGIGRETHKMMLDHYQQTKNLLVSYAPKALGFFQSGSR